MRSRFVLIREGRVGAASHRSSGGHDLTRVGTGLGRGRADTQLACGSGDWMTAGGVKAPQHTRSHLYSCQALCFWLHLPPPLTRVGSVCPGEVSSHCGRDTGTEPASSGCFGFSEQSGIPGSPQGRSHCGGGGVDRERQSPARWMEVDTSLFHVEPPASPVRLGSGKKTQRLLAFPSREEGCWPRSQPRAACLDGKVGYRPSLHSPGAASGADCLRLGSLSSSPTVALRKCCLRSRARSSSNCFL